MSVTSPLNKSSVRPWGNPGARERMNGTEILVVEDEPAIQELIAVNLEHAGHRVQRAYSAAEAENIIRDVRPDLILLDWMLPDLTGTALARKLRADPRFQATPILILTTESGDLMKQAGRAAGATGWLVKPFDPVRLLEVVKKVIR